MTQSGPACPIKYIHLSYNRTKIRSIRIIGVCTDICVISNAMLLRAALPEAKIILAISAPQSLRAFYKGRFRRYRSGVSRQ